MGERIKTTLPDDVIVDWDFPIHPDKAVLNAWKVRDPVTGK